MAAMQFNKLQKHMLHTKVYSSLHRNDPTDTYKETH